MKRYRIAVLFDTMKISSTGETLGWAYYKRALSLKDHAPEDFDVEILSAHDFRRAYDAEKLQRLDLVFLLEYTHVGFIRQYLDWGNRNCKLVVSHNSDRHRRHDFWHVSRHNADFVIANNQCVFDFFNRPARTCAISNGVDTRWWNVKTPIADRPDRILWCGSSNPKKQKGYEILMAAQPKLESLGFECSFRPIDDINETVVFPTAKQAEWYQSGGYVVCTSLSEATPGTSLEGMACGCALVTTHVGAAKEMPGDCYVRIDRDVDDLIRGLCEARERRVELAERGAVLMRDHWSYGEPARRSENFYSLFRRICEGVEVKPFTYTETKAGDI